MSADATLLDNDLRPRLQSLQARLARDGIVTALPPPSTISILLAIASVRFIVTWSDAGIVVKTTVSDAAARCFSSGRCRLREACSATQSYTVILRKPWLS